MACPITVQTNAGPGTMPMLMLTRLLAATVAVLSAGGVNGSRCIVTDVRDYNRDIDPYAVIPNTLRWCLDEAAVDGSLHEIHFALSLPDGGGVVDEHTIVLHRPIIIQPDRFQVCTEGVVIDATTQPDATLLQPRSGPKIVFTPSAMHLARTGYHEPAMRFEPAALPAESRAMAVRGLGARGFPRGSAWVRAPGVTIEGGLFADSTNNGGTNAVLLAEGTNVTVRDSSFVNNDGYRDLDLQAAGPTIEHCRIGVYPNGTVQPAATGSTGIFVGAGASNARIFRTTVGQKLERGIFVSGDNVLIADSWIGVTPDGTPVPNLARGIFISGGQIQRFQVLRTAISNNFGEGIHVRASSTGGLIDGCHIANQTGTDGMGIFLEGGADGVVVRNTTVIYNQMVGVKTTGPRTIVEDCRIGVNTGGTAASNGNGNLNVGRAATQLIVRRTTFGAAPANNVVVDAPDATVADCTIGITADVPPVPTRGIGVQVGAGGVRFTMSRTVVGNVRRSCVYLTAPDAVLDDVRVGISSTGGDLGCKIGIQVDGADRAMLRNVTVGFSTQRGIAVMQSSRASIINSHIGITADGVATPNAWSGIRGYAAAEDTLIENTTVANNGRRGVYWQGRFGVIDGCYIGTNFIGVAAGNGLTPGQDEREGIYFESGAEGCTVRNTVVANNGASGITTAAPNTLIQDSFVGILRDGSCAHQNRNCINLQEVARNSTVEGSTIGSCENSGVGVFNEAHNATIRANFIGAPPSGRNCSVGRHGVQVFQSDYPTVVDNIIRFTARSAMRVGRASTLGYTGRNNTEDDPTNRWNTQACGVCDCTDIAGEAGGVQVDCTRSDLGADFPTSFPANTTHIIMPHNQLELLDWAALRGVASTLQVLDMSNNPRLDTVPDFDAIPSQPPFPVLKVLQIGNTDFSRATADTLRMFRPVAGALYTLGLQGLALTGRPPAGIALNLTGFGPELGVISWHDVTLCPAGYYSAVESQEARLNPELYNQCIRCPVGTYQGAIGTDSYNSCERCPFGHIDADNDPTTPCEYRGEETMTIASFGNEVDTQSALPYLRYDTGQSAGGGRILARRKWTIASDEGESPTYHIAPIHVTANSSATGLAIVVSFRLDPVPPGFFMNTETGEVLGVPALRPGQLSYNRTSTLYAVTSGLADKVLGTIDFDFAVRDVDPGSSAVGPDGLDCVNGGVRNESGLDDGIIEFDGRHGCDCSAASGYQGRRCEHAPTSSSSVAGDNDATTDIALVVAGVIILGLLVAVAAVVYREKKRKWSLLQAYDFQAEQDALASEKMFSGLMATTGTLDGAGGGGIVIPRELPRKTITIKHDLGAGAFGVVYMGMMRETARRSAGSSVYISAMPEYPVAVKSLKEGPSSDERKEFLREALVSAQFDHENVVAVIGVITSGSPQYLVIQYCEKGSLEGMLEDNNKRIPEPTLIGYMLGTAKGMQYLATRHFVHRDLASRNVLVDNLDRAKVCDFGMSRDMDGGSYYTVADASKTRIPLRWSAPEALKTMKFSEKSDVWSYGITVVEMYSNGEDPYRGWMNTFVAERVMAGFVHERPDDCPKHIYDSIILPCLTFDPHVRVKFADLVPVLTNMLREQQNVTLAAANMSAKLDVAQIEGFRTADGAAMVKIEEIDGVRFTAIEAEMMRSFVLISEDTAYDFQKEAKQREGDTTAATDVNGIMLTAMEVEMLEEVAAQNRAGYREKAKRRLIAVDVEPGADGNYAYEFVPSANDDPGAPSEGNSAYEFVPDSSAAPGTVVYTSNPEANAGADELSAAARPVYARSTKRHAKAAKAPLVSGSSDSQYIGFDDSAKERSQQTAYMVPASQQGEDDEEAGFGFGFPTD